ncbi:MAG: radical SAM protein [Lachnospiraceae bacterium]|nr:radical SAM protein [Lachnospiraceae bacterium]
MNRDDLVQSCSVCVRHCRLNDGETGFCGARKNIEGRILSVGYGKLTFMTLEEIERRPLRMYLPGNKILTVGSFGCDYLCPWCQNHVISRADEKTARWKYISPEQLVRTALKMKKKGNIGIAYSFNEPLVNWEYVRDAARLASAKGLKNVLVTNGSAEIRVLERIIRYFDAMNIDLKCFSEEKYRALGGELEDVKRFIERASDKCHVEVSTLIVPGWNDSEEEMEAMSDWLSWISYTIPLHVTRYFPGYQMNEPPTSEQKIQELAATARKNLQNVFVENC